MSAPPDPLSFSAALGLVASFQFQSGSFRLFGDVSATFWRRFGDFPTTSNYFNGLRFTFCHSLKLLVEGLLDFTKLDAGAYCFSHLWGADEREEREGEKRNEKEDGREWGRERMKESAERERERTRGGRLQNSTTALVSSSHRLLSHLGKKVFVEFSGADIRHRVSPTSPPLVHSRDFVLPRRQSLQRGNAIVRVEQYAASLGIGDVGCHQ